MWLRGRPEAKHGRRCFTRGPERVGCASEATLATACASAERQRRHPGHHGRAAVVAPDNVLFEGGAGETVRRHLLEQCDVHTLLRLPTGIFYAGGVKANVLFFDRKPPSETPWTKTLWIYDLRTNQNFTLKTRALVRGDLDDFVARYNADNRHERVATEQFKCFTYEELMARDKASLDIFWLRDDSLEDTDNLPAPEVIAAEIVEDLEAALVEFRAVAESLGKGGA